MILLALVLTGCDSATRPAPVAPGATALGPSTPVSTGTTPTTPPATSSPTAPTGELVVPADASMALTEPGVALPLGDVDGDGVDDLVLDGDLGVWRKLGPMLDPSPGDPVVSLPGDDSGGGYPAGDATGDGLDDLLLWANDGWYPRTTFASDLLASADPAQVSGGLGMEVAWGATRGDVDGDGQPELVIPNYGEVSACEAPLPGKVAKCTTIAGSSDAEFGLSAAAGDLDADGVDDVVATARASWEDEYYCSPRVYAVTGPITADIPAIDDGTGGTQWLAPDNSCYAPTDPVIADFDGDGTGDVAVVAFEPYTDQGVVVLLSGDLTEIGGLSAVGSSVATLAAADVNGDGASDLLAGGIDEGWVVPGPLTGQQDLALAAWPHVRGPAAGAGWTVRALDRDADGDQDLVVSNVLEGVWFLDGPF